MKSAPSSLPLERAPATVRDVAREAGVSTATVSRVLNEGAAVAGNAASAGGLRGGKARVAAATRDRVLAAAAALDYQANHVARSLKIRSTRTIAILAPELANDFFMELAEGVERELGASGYMLLIASSAASPEEEERRLRVLSERLVDGIIAIPAGPRGEHLQAVADRGTPVVLVDRAVEGAALDTVLADNEGGAFAATAALIADGFARICFVGGDAAITTARERLAGFGRAMGEAGLPAREVRLGGMGIADGYRLMDSIMEENDPPRALFAVNLLVHLGMERRLLEEGRGALDRFAMASFDETPYSPFMTACRYAVAQPAAEMGAAAARLVLERIVARQAPPTGALAPRSPAPRTLRLPTTLIRHPRG